MFLWEGREVWWRGHEVIIIRRIDKKYVEVARKSRPYMRLMVKRDEISRA